MPPSRIAPPYSEAELLENVLPSIVAVPYNVRNTTPPFCAEFPENVLLTTFNDPAS